MHAVESAKTKSPWKKVSNEETLDRDAPYYYRQQKDAQEKDTKEQRSELEAKERGEQETHAVESAKTKSPWKKVSNEETLDRDAPYYYRQQQEAQEKDTKEQRSEL